MSATELTIQQSGFLTRRRTWQRDQIERIMARPSGISTSSGNKRETPVLQLEVLARPLGGGEPQAHGFFPHLPSEMVKSLALALRDQLGIPRLPHEGESTENPGDPDDAHTAAHPNARGYLQLTQFDQWEPGTRIHLSRRRFSLTGQILAFVLLTAVLGVVGAFVLPFVLAFVTGLTVIALEAFLELDLEVTSITHRELMVFSVALVAVASFFILRPVFAARDIELNWATGQLSVRTATGSQVERMADIRGLEIRPVSSKRQVDSGRTGGRSRQPEFREEYRAELVARVNNREVLLLETDEWEGDAKLPHRELMPAAQQLARSLGTKLNEGPARVDSLPHFKIWRNPWAVASLAVVILVLVGRTLWLAQAAIPEARQREQNRQMQEAADQNKPVTDA